MNSFTVIAIPTEVAGYVRTKGKSPIYGFPAHKEVSEGRAPCGHSLKLIREQQEELLLFTYDPFREVAAPPLPGPVYVHADKCFRHAGDHEFPAVYRGRELTFAAYSIDGTFLKGVFMTDGGETEKANRLFREPTVEYIHVRSTETGCLLFRLQRA